MLLGKGCPMKSSRDLWPLSAHGPSTGMALARFRGGTHSDIFLLGLLANFRSSSSRKLVRGEVKMLPGD